MSKYIGELITGDFEENTMTFEIEGEMVLKAGRYVIIPVEEFDITHLKSNT